MKLIDIGYGNSAFVNADKVVAIVAPESAPINRMVSESKDQGLCTNATFGRKTKSVIILETNQIVLSPLTPQSILSKLQK